MPPGLTFIRRLFQMSQFSLAAATTTPASSASTRPPTSLPPTIDTTGRGTPDVPVAVRTQTDQGPFTSRLASGMESGAPAIPIIGPRGNLAIDFEDTDFCLPPPPTASFAEA